MKIALWFNHCTLSVFFLRLSQLPLMKLSNFKTLKSKVFLIDVTKKIKHTFQIKLYLFY